MTPNEPGLYLIANDHFPMGLEVEVYLSKKGHLRVRASGAFAEAMERGEPFRGKKLSTFSEKWTWEKIG